LNAAGLGVLGGATLANGVGCSGQRSPVNTSSSSSIPYDVRRFGAVGDGRSIDSAAINAAIDAAAKSGGGTVFFPCGVYASYSIRLKSNVTLFLDSGATILAAPTPLHGLDAGGYDPAESNGGAEPYQDYGHNHWHNSLIWGENLANVGITGPGLVWGKGLSRGHDERSLPDTTAKGVGNKAIALKNCHNIILSDFSILQGGWFGILATGVDNLTIDNVKIDTNRDGMDIDCCRNVRVSNCTVNSPWDDAICLKSSYGLGYPRDTRDVTVSNCYVTGAYELGSVLDGTWKRMNMKPEQWGTGRIKCGTESNGGFKNIVISNCIFDSCRGLAIESADGAIVEDIAITNLTMRNVLAPIFLRLGTRLRGPAASTQVGSMKRILIRNIVSSSALQLPSSIAGIVGHDIEDIKISDVYLEQVGGGPAEWKAIQPDEKAEAYPEPSMFGPLPASGIFVRHAGNVELSNVEIAVLQPDSRPAFYLDHVRGADLFRLKTPRGQTGQQFRLKNVSDFRLFGCKNHPDAVFDESGDRMI
jgi:polygalacturonase